VYCFRLCPLPDDGHRNGTPHCDTNAGCNPDENGGEDVLVGGPRDWSHEYTGRKRQITLREPEYERQYEFEFEKRHSETVYVYLAENRTKVEPAAYEWQIERTVTRRSVAEVEAMAPNTRIGASRPTKEWVLEKQVGTEVVTPDHTKPEWDVLETIGRGEATIVEQYVRHQGKQTFGRHTRERQIEVNLTSRGFYQRNRLEI